MIDLNDAPAVRSSHARYDLDAIVSGLRATAQTWVPRLFPNGRRVGDEWRLANIHGAPPRKTGSCVIALCGQHAGDWHDFDTGEGGGPLSAIEHATGLSGRELFAYAADLVGWTPSEATHRVPAAIAPSSRHTDTRREIAFILDHAEPLQGTSAAAYLLGRGLVLPSNSDLRAHADLTHWQTKSGYPALIAPVRDRAGDIVALHRTYLQTDPEKPDRVTKAAVANPRLMLGSTRGGAVRLAPIGDSGVLALSEGIETGLAVMAAIPSLAVWATLSTAGLEQAQLPAEAKRIIVLADHDVSGAGLRAAEATAQRLRLEGREVAVAMPPAAGDDFNDLLLQSGPAAVRAVIEAALPKAEPDEPANLGLHRPINFTEPAAPLPMFRSDEGDLARAVARTWSLLLGSNSTPWLFRHGGVPTWVVPDDEGRPVAARLTDERLRHMLAKLAFWHRVASDGEITPTHPPLPLVKSVLATPDPALPVLVGIVNTPVYGRNGKLLTTPGYHPDARLLYCPQPNFALPLVSERPSADELAAARTLICQDLFGDFPFVSPSEHSHAVALLLLGFVRSMIDGPTPLHLIEKPTPGTGATLMVDAIATILTGTGASVMTEGRDDEEWRKRMTAKLRQIPAMVLIDNLRHRLDSSAVAAALTAPFWEDRILGASEMARMPIRCVWVATGNNPEFSNEMARRIIRIRLDAHVERPWQRAGFRHPDLLSWVRANRAHIVAACLTLCQAWIAAGRPRGTRTIGSYENWSQIVGGVLEIARIEGFLGNLDEMLEASDSEGMVWRNFVCAWWDRFGTAEVGTAELYDLALKCEPPLPLGAGNEKSQRIRLGKALVRMCDRIFDHAGVARRIAASGISHQAKRWQLVIAGTPDERVANRSTAGGGECREPSGNVADKHSPSHLLENGGVGESGEGGECFSILTRARARARVKEEARQPSPPSPHSQFPESPGPYAGESSGEGRSARSPISDEPDWLKDVP